MSENKSIRNALVSVFNKDRLDKIITLLHKHGVQLYSTGGTQTYIESLNVPVTPVEKLTGFPSILGGRVKTLHPNVFGGILARRDLNTDLAQLEEYKIPAFDLVIVDLYPFEDTVASGASHQNIIEKIDIGGISLIRAAAKNYKDVIVIASKDQYEQLGLLLEENNTSTEEQRRHFAMEAFALTSHYDTSIFNYFSQNEVRPSQFRHSEDHASLLRYGENPHQQGVFFGDLNEVLKQEHGKEISYNNLLDIDAAIHLMSEFTECTFAVIKHNNACGIASRPILLDAWKEALSCDPISAFGGVLICNRTLDEATAREINQLFFEILIAPSYSEEALLILKQKKNRILLVQKSGLREEKQFRSLLNGVIVQDKDLKIETKEDLKVVTTLAPCGADIENLLFANKIVKHSKSNAIVIVNNSQLIASGIGQTSRVDALNHAIEKAKHFGFNLEGAVMASDAFFPFADCVEIAYKAGIRAVIQPGGSVKDAESIGYCDRHGMAMVLTGVRHFKH